MISVEHVTQRFGGRCVLDDVSCVFERGHSVGILGMNGAGKSTLLRIIAGTQDPTEGRVRRYARVSWRLGMGGFHGSLTGAENVLFASRIYGVDPHDALDYVESFAELGDYLFKPVSTYSSGMRGRLALGLSLALTFDVYLVDEGTSAGDARFQQRYLTEVKERFKTSDVIMVSHSASTLQKYCSHGAVLHEGRLSEIVPLRDAMAVYHRILNG